MAKTRRPPHSCLATQFFSRSCPLLAPSADITTCLIPPPLPWKAQTRRTKAFEFGSWWVNFSRGFREAKEQTRCRPNLTHCRLNLTHLGSLGPTLDSIWLTQVFPRRPPFSHPFRCSPCDPEVAPQTPKTPKNSKTRKSDSEVTFGGPGESDSKVTQKRLKSDKKRSKKVTFWVTFWLTFESLSLGHPESHFWVTFE